jgi:hypothetical protein
VLCYVCCCLCSTGCDVHYAQGRRSALEEQILELKRKLKTPLYKDIDKRHRIKVPPKTSPMCYAVIL